MFHFLDISVDITFYLQLAAVKYATTRNDEPHESVSSLSSLVEQQLEMFLHRNSSRLISNHNTMATLSRWETFDLHMQPLHSFVKSPLLSYHSSKMDRDPTPPFFLPPGENFTACRCH